MKRIIFYTLVFLIACIAGVKAQSFKPTYYNTCLGCVPPGYEIISGSPAISTPTGLGGDQNFPWSVPKVNFPNPPTFIEGEHNSIGVSSQKSFLTLKHQNHPKADQKDVVRVLINKFVPGKLYNLKLHTLFSKLISSSSAITATVKISTDGPSPMTLKTVTINNTGEYTWKQTAIGFTPSTDALIFTFSVDAAVSTTGYVNFDIGNYPFDCIIPTAQVQLFHANETTRYPCGRIALDDFEKSTTPPNGKLIWKKGADASAENLISNLVSAAPVGEYYAFYRDQTMPSCYNVQTSTAKAVLSHVPEQVPVTKTMVSNECPTSTASLASSYYYSNIDEEVRYFPNNTHQGAHVPDPYTVTTPGDYYAFWYSKTYKCYSTDLSTSKVTVTIKPCCAAGTAQVALSRPNAVNTCPATTVNLNNTKVTNQPPFTSVVWFTDAGHTNAVADPTKANAGTYYAFFKDNTTGCFNTDLSTTTLTVTINACQPAKVDLNLKVFLQGATTQENGVATMRNDLQVYQTGASTFGLLPTQDPYGGGAVYPEIKSTFSKVGNVVDWVKVEIRSMQNPSVILESKSLLLRVDGTVLDVDGFAPKFNPQFGGVRIAVKHRNHLGVLGLGIVSFNAGTVNYDFTADLSKAYNVGAPAQMVLTNGVWCMISGDIQQDFTVDNADLSNERISFNKGDFDAYKLEDFNLDGIVDNVDISFFKTSFNKGYFSTLINY